jgi:hypothetical protein
MLTLLQTFFYLPEGELERKGAVLMVQQMLIVLVECIAQSNELIARLGCSCFR